MDEAVAAYRERFGPYPAFVQDLVAAGLLPEIPPDPYGGVWTIDGEGRVHSTSNYRRLFRPDDESKRSTTLDRLRSKLRSMQPQ